jgi:hypothetical protein
VQTESVTELVTPIHKKKDDKNSTSNANQQTSQPYFDKKKNDATENVTDNTIEKKSLKENNYTETY